MPRSLLLGSLLAGLMLAGPGRAFAQAGPDEPPAPSEAADSDATKLACAKAYEMSQRLRQDGKLLKAREQALACAQPSCPALLVGDCTGWLGELDAALPSVIVEVRDARGQALANAQVTVDGEPFAASLDGRALLLDPGPRRFRITLPSGKLLERQLVVTQGQKGQPLRFDLPAEAPALPAPRAATRGSRALGYGAAAFSVAGAVGFAYFGLQGRADEQRLHDSCAPRCSDAELAPLGRTYLAADVSLGVGVAALGLLGYLWLTSETESSASSSAVGASVSERGAALSFRETF